MGMGGPFGRLLPPGKDSDSDGLTPTALHLNPVLFMSLWQHQVRTPRDTDLRVLVLGGKAMGLFQGDPEVGRSERESEG